MVYKSKIENIAEKLYGAAKYSTVAFSVARFTLALITLPMLLNFFSIFSTQEAQDMPVTLSVISFSTFNSPPHLFLAEVVLFCGFPQISLIS